MTLKELRISKGLTQKQVAEKCGITEQAYAHYEKYRRKIPVNIAYRLCEIFEDISAKDLLRIICGFG